MRLRDLKHSGGFLLPDARGGWRHFHEGELARCPHSDCLRAWMKVAVGKVVSTRPVLDVTDSAVIGVVTCRECRRNFELGTPRTASEARPGVSAATP